MTKKPSLAETHPDLAAQADGWDPNTVVAGSGRKVLWKCKFHHNWTARPADRITGKGCPVCTNKSVLVGFNDLATTNPELAAQADGWDPTTLTSGSSKKVRWKCKLDHSWETTVDSRNKRGSGCPICVNKSILVGFNDLATTNPGLSAQADGWDPTTVTEGSGKRLDWRCPEGHKWEASVKDRKKAGCPYCSGREVVVGTNDLSSLFPELAQEADGWNPKEIHAASHKKMPWKCDLGHSWSANVDNRSKNQAGCPFCSGNTVLVGFNDLETLRPDIAKELVGTDPSKMSIGSNRKCKWKCSLGHEWLASVKSRSRGQGCPICSGNEVLIGFNDLATTHPEVAAQLVDKNTSKLSRGTHKKCKWKCAEGHTWMASVNSRTNGWRGTITGCPICANKEILIGYNDLATTHPELLSEIDGWDAKKFTFGSPAKKSWICHEGHKWTTAINVRTSGRSCPTCSKSGFDPNRQGFLYFLDHFDLQMFQIGITSYPQHRLDDHKRGGWEVIELRGPMDGHLTQKLENDCLHALEKRGAILGHKAGIEKFDGYSEAWTKSSLNVTSIKQILDWVYEDESN